jgi:hypothetical protein
MLQDLWFLLQGPKIMGQTITNSYGDLEVLQAYKNNVKDILKLLITLKIT